MVGKPAILFTSLQTQFDEQGRYDDKVMHSLSMQASDNVGINGTWIAAKRAASAAETASSVAAVDLGFVPFGNGIVNIPLPLAGALRDRDVPGGGEQPGLRRRRRRELGDRHRRRRGDGHAARDLPALRQGLLQQHLDGQRELLRSGG